MGKPTIGGFLIMNAISFKKWVSTILLLAITISLCGCSTNRTAASQDEHLTTTTAFIVLNGANVPALNSSAIASFVDTPQDGDRSILIVPDGNPSITTFSFDSTAKKRDLCNCRVQKMVQRNLYFNHRCKAGRCRHRFALSDFTCG